jgi:hypothetical protein
MDQNNQKKSFCSYCFGAFGHPQMDQKGTQKARKWTRWKVQCSSLKISPYPNQKAHSCKKNGPKQPENSFFSAGFGPFGTLK